MVIENTAAAVDVQFDDSVRKLLATVDSLIDKASVEILKFGMRTEILQAKRDIAAKPSDLYFALSESVIYSDNPTLLLARFIYAL